MSDIVVLDHRHDRNAEAYRLVIGWVEDRQRVALDEKGEPIPPGEDGAQQFETYQHVLDSEEILFSALDPKWEGMEPEEISKEQRRIVRARLREMEKEAKQMAAAVAQHPQLPGVGGKL